ncbi:cytochrome c3 family protein [Altererythrobacter sp.]|uniref:cytochrome c3 family protein n=1 Tax=Altererythrobacter sp. TaxID=1872480 RepID=UPI003D028855
MAFLIRTIDFTAAGREIVRDREHGGDTLSIGRASENDVHLPDLAVEQQHARIEPVPGGHLRAVAAGTLGFTHDGRTVTEAVFNPREGAELGFGSYRLAFSQEGDGPVTITQRQVDDKVGDSEALSGFALASVMPSKRVMSWIGLAAILVAFLAIPIVSNLTREKVEPDYKAPGKVAMDGSWSTGALSFAHHGLEDNCEACHVVPFQAVRDETCLACHKGTGDHAPKPRQLAGRGPLSAGDSIQWAVAETLGKEGPGACTTCHTEHEGPMRMAPPAQAFCAECHDGMDARLTDTVLGNASDFGKAHPQFKALIRTMRGEPKPERVSLAKKPKEFNGLRFPHKLHLDPRGGAARMAASLGPRKGYGEALVCKDCHTPTKDKLGFLPVDMEDDCEACHSLVYDKVGSTFRTLRHGDVDQMLADLRAMDRSPRVPVVSGRKRPGEYASGRLYHQNFGPPSGSLVAINRALKKNGVCGECHIPTILNGRPDVVPVDIPDFYLVNGFFDHEAHKEEKCSDCHAAETSKTSDDLLIPGIAVCRDCHLGEDAPKGKVASSCAMCHAYHPPTGKIPHDHPPTEPKQVALSTRKGD